MSPADAIDNPIFLRYVVVVGGILVVAGLLLTCLQLVLRKGLGGVWRTYRSWWVMAPVAIGAVFAGRETTLAGVCLLGLLAFREYGRATGLAKDRWLSGLVYVQIVAVGVASLVASPKTGQIGWYGLFMALPVYCVGLLLTVPIIRNRADGQLKNVSLAILGFAYFGWMFGHLGFFVNAEFRYGYVLYLILAVEINDVAAFTFGKLFGRTPLRSGISPNKTLEGALGALVVSLALPWALHFSFPHFGTWDLILTGLIVGVGGQLGDLAISFIKRDLGVKDMGSAIPGHGGVLDRVDSLVFVSPLFFHMVRYLHGIY